MLVIKKTIGSSMLGEIERVIISEVHFKMKLEAVVSLKNQTTDFVKYHKITVPPKKVIAGVVSVVLTLFF